MEFERKFQGDQEYNPLQIYFMEKMDPKLVDAAKVFHLPILEPELNNNMLMTTPLTQTIYIFNDFEEHKMFPIVENTPKTWILGPTALDEMSQNPDLELRSKPTYCTFMYPLVFYINCPEDVPLMKYIVKRIKWMGGRFATTPNRHTTHMVTNHVLSKGYSYCAANDIPIISPAWVDFCWQHRNLPNFDVTDQMENFRVKAFDGLCIAFKSPFSELKKLEDEAKANGAVVVQPSDSHCTHWVVSRADIQPFNVTDIPTHIKYVIEEGWFFSSVEQGYRVPEDRYLYFPEIKESLWAVINAKTARCSIKARRTTKEFLLNDTINSEIQKQNVKRKYAFEDLYLKEKNFLCCVKQLCKIKNLATNTLHPEGIILNEKEACTVFGNLTELVEIHQELFKCFGCTLKEWETDAVTVRPLIEFSDSLLKQYVIYTTNYKESKQLLEDLEKKNKRFRKLLENFKNLNKEHPKDMFIRPIQRLCSLLLQIQEISKYTREDNPDKEVLEVAFETLRDVIQQVNDTGVLTEQPSVTSDISNCITKISDSFPVTVYHGDFIVQFSAQEVVSQGVAGMQVTFFLFNNILEIMKAKSKYFQFSKQSVHLATIPMSLIVNVIEFQSTEKDEQKTFGLKVKMSKEEDTSLYCFQYSNRDFMQLKNILILIAKQMVPKDSSKTPEAFIQQCSSFTGLSINRITKYKGKRFNQAIDDLKTRPNLKTNLRRSRSCGDMIDALKSSNEL